SRPRRCLPRQAGLKFLQFISPQRSSHSISFQGGLMGIAVSPIQIDSRVSDFIAKPRQMLIDGKWVNAASGKTFPTYNPATGEVLAQSAAGWYGSSPTCWNNTSKNSRL